MENTSYKLIYFLKLCIAATATIFTKLTVDTQNFVKKSYIEIYDNAKPRSVADKSQTDRWTDGQM